MNSFVLSAEAQLDFFEALQFIARYSLKAATDWESNMLEAFRHLAQWPKTGRIRPEYAPAPFRFWVVDDYLLIYDSEASPVTIVAIFHGAQELSTLIAARLADPEPSV